MGAQSNSLINKVFKYIADAFGHSVSVEVEQPAYRSYPYLTAWKGHNQAVQTILESDVSFLTSPTGTGKTAVYLTAAAESGLKTMVVVPRNGLQVQVAEYEVGVPILYLFDRSKHCDKVVDGRPPCNRKFLRDGKWYFKLNGKVVEFPCSDCPYEQKKREIKSLFRSGHCIAVLNQGNFWMLRGDTEFVIIDEADETLRSITDAVSYPERYESDDPLEVLAWMRERVNEDAQKIMAALESVRSDDELEKLNKALEKLKRKLNKIDFFAGYPPDKLITYVKGSSTYVEIFDDPVTVARRLFSEAKICFVTATPPISSGNGVKNVEFRMPFKARVIYAPVGNLSERNVFRNGNENLLEEAVDFIIKTYDYTVKLTGMKKAPIHCGNLSKHGLKVYEILKANGRKALLMEEGQQAKFVDMFVKGDYDFLCAVAIEYGYDWGFSPIQYILKVPFADLGDPRLGAIKRLLGKDKFEEWYNWGALSRLIQACGRNARRPDDFGVTIILDSCFERLYKRFENKIPKWFKERLIWLGGDGDGEGR